MKQTEQCGLNQWELSDRIRMEDFNADNAKIAAELARLEEGLFNLAYSVGQLALVDALEDKLFFSHCFLLADAFHHPQTFQGSDNVIIEQFKVTLTGRGSTGWITTNRLHLGYSAAKKVRLWIHYDGGSVKPYINGVPMVKDRYDVSDRSPSVGVNTYSRVFSLDLPYRSELNFRLEMDCGNSDSMVIHDLCIARI